MTTPSHFYVTLPSNSSEHYFGKQPLNHYTTMLPHLLKLDTEEWEVGLAEIIYPYTWKNLTTATDIKVGFSNLELNKDTKKYDIYFETFTVQGSFYTSTKDLVDKLNRRIRQSMHKLKKEDWKTIEEGEVHYRKVHEKFFKMVFRYDENVRKVYLSGNKYFFISLPVTIGQMLGFGDHAAVIGSELVCPQILENERCIRNTTSYTFENHDEQAFDDHTLLLKGKYHSDVHRGCTTMYVYSPIIQSQFVGDTHAPLLRAISVDGEFGKTINVRYNHIYYLPLAQSHIDQIEVYIKDDVGRSFPFESGRVTVVLHFRKKTL